jgi:hypothetical protein
MGDGVTSSVNARANQAGHDAASSSADSAAQTEFAKAKQSAIAEMPMSIAQKLDEESGLAHHGARYTAQTGGTDKKNLGATAIGAGVIDRHPKGDRAKMKAYEHLRKGPQQGIVICQSKLDRGRALEVVPSLKFHRALAKTFHMIECRPDAAIRHTWRPHARDRPGRSKSCASLYGRQVNWDRSGWPH